MYTYIYVYICIYRGTEGCDTVRICSQLTQKAKDARPKLKPKEEKEGAGSRTHGTCVEVVAVIAPSLLGKDHLDEGYGLAFLRGW